MKCQHQNHRDIYRKVKNVDRLKLLKMTKVEGHTLKDAARMLNMNYSTAKTIVRVYRREKRIFKKTPYKNLPKTTSNYYFNSNTKSNSFHLSNQRNEPDLSLGTYRRDNKTFPTNKELNSLPTPHDSMELLTSFKMVVSNLKICTQVLYDNEKLIKNIKGSLKNFGPFRAREKQRRRRSQLTYEFFARVNKCSPIQQSQRNFSGKGKCTDC